VTASVRTLPVTDGRLAGWAAAPWDGMALVELAIERADRLADLVARCAPAAEISAAAEAAMALRGPLASLKLVADVLLSAYRAGCDDMAAVAKPAPRVPRPQLRAVPGSKGTTAGLPGRKDGHS
jgi:hypothetical protein